MINDTPNIIRPTNRKVFWFHFLLSKYVLYNRNIYRDMLYPGFEIKSRSTIAAILKDVSNKGYPRVCFYYICQIYRYTP